MPYSISTMQLPKFLYAVFGGPAPGRVDEVIAEAFSQSKQLSQGSWLVATTQPAASAVYEEIKRTAGEDIQCIVLSFATDYYGWMDKSVWDFVHTTQWPDDE